MIWVAQRELAEAVDAMRALVRTCRMPEGARIIHETHKFDDRKWETIICGMIAAQGSSPDSVLPEYSYEVHGFGGGSGDESSEARSA